MASPGLVGACPLPPGNNWLPSCSAELGWQTSVFQFNQAHPPSPLLGRMVAATWLLRARLLLFKQFQCSRYNLLLSLPVWLLTHFPHPRCALALSAFQNPEAAENSSHLSVFLMWSGLFFFASGFPPPQLSHSLFSPPQLSAGNVSSLDFETGTEKESSEKNRPVPPRSPFAVAAIFLLFLPL